MLRYTGIAVDFIEMFSDILKGFGGKSRCG